MIVPMSNIIAGCYLLLTKVAKLLADSRKYSLIQL